MKYLNNGVRIPETAEAAIQHAIVDLLRWHGWKVVETSQISRVIKMTGFPDVIAFKLGVTWLIEVKREGENLRPSQVEFRKEIKPHLSDPDNAPTLCYMVARSVDEVIEQLPKVEKGCKS